MDNGFEAFWVAWVEASPEWDDAAGNYRTIAEEAWEQGQATLQAENERLRKALADISAECAQENMDGEPYDTFHEIARRGLNGEPPTEGEEPEQSRFSCELGDKCGCTDSWIAYKKCIYYQGGPVEFKESDNAKP